MHGRDIRREERDDGKREGMFRTPRGPGGRRIYVCMCMCPADRKPRGILNAMYMKVWRRVVGQPRYQKSEMTDLQVRQKLGVPSIDCYLRQKRLLYFSRLARAEIPALHASLQARGLKGEPMPWARQILNDIAIMCAHPDVATKVADMPNAGEDCQQYFNFARDFPEEWKALVKRYHTPHDDFTPMKRSNANTPAPQQGTHKCEQCGQDFQDERQLKTHMWSKHKVKASFRNKVGDISVCPVFHTQFHTRQRLIKHLLEKRVRAKNRSRSC